MRLPGNAPFRRKGTSMSRTVPTQAQIRRAVTAALQADRRAVVDIMPDGTIRVQVGADTGPATGFDNAPRPGNGDDGPEPWDD